jgi:hypothetical protein
MGFGNGRSHPNGVVFDEATGRLVNRPPMGEVTMRRTLSGETTELPHRLATTDKSPEMMMMENLRLTRQELRGKITRDEANEANPAGQRLGSPVDLLLDFDPYPISLDGYEARLQARLNVAGVSPDPELGAAVLTPAALERSTSSSGAAAAGANPGGEPSTHAVPQSPKSPPPFRRFFEDSGNGAVGDGRKVKMGANGDRGQSAEEGKEKGNGATHTVGNGIAHPSGNGVAPPAENGITPLPRSAVTPTVRNGLVPTARRAATLAVGNGTLSQDGLRTSRFAASLQRQQQPPARQRQQKAGLPRQYMEGRILSANKPGVTFQGLADEDEEQDFDN